VSTPTVPLPGAAPHAHAQHAVPPLPSCPAWSKISQRKKCVRWPRQGTIKRLEASPTNGKVKFWIEDEEDFVSFCVWNKAFIPQSVAPRIFQRNFSTKEQDGRGIGTYSMKLFGEKILNGRVSFTTSETDGTIFKFACPT